MVRDTYALELMYSTMQICSMNEADVVSSGTGFSYSHRTDSGLLPFLVTNKHVVEGATTVRLYFTRAAGSMPQDGPLFGDRIEMTYNDFDKGWHGHPDPAVDVAIFPLSTTIAALVGGGDRPYIRHLEQRHIPSEADLDDCDVIEDIMFVGYPNGIQDEYNLLPLVRRGITATPPMADFAGRHEVLIDASVFPGSSGSPVFVWDSDSAPDYRSYGKPRFLLGVLSAAMFRNNWGQIIKGEVPTEIGQGVVYQEMIDIGVVVKASRIIEAIEDWLTTHEVLPPPEDWPNHVPHGFERTEYGG